MAAAADLRGAQREAAEAVAQPGDWLTGAQRLAVWAEARDAATNPLDQQRATALSPYGVDGAHPGTDLLSAAAVEVVHRLASDPGRLTRSWAEANIAELGEHGEETYVELVAITSIVTVIDRFSQSLGEPLPEPPAVVAGDPARVRPDGVGDVGAWVAQSLRKTRANVSRAVSLVPRTQATWGALVNAYYSRGAEFFDLEWNRSLSRPQVELIAARTTALNECFY